MDQDQQTIRELEARLASLRAGEAAERPVKKAGIPAWIWVVAPVIVALFLMDALVRLDRQSAPDVEDATARYEGAVARYQAVRSQIAAKAAPGPFTPAQRREVDGVLRDRLPGGFTMVLRQEFYFDGAPTMCGSLVANGQRRSQRFILRNGNVVMDGDVDPADFRLIDQVCAVAPVP